MSALQWRWRVLGVSIWALAVGCVLALASIATNAFAQQRPIVFHDAQRQAAEFMEHERRITLTPEQEAVMREALTAIDAPCCDDETAYTCCCPCNMALAWWGLAKYLIAERGATAEEVRATTVAWLEFINPRGFTGDACYTPNGCERPFNQNGCGGMDRDNMRAKLRAARVHAAASWRASLLRHRKCSCCRDA